MSADLNTRALMMFEAHKRSATAAYLLWIFLGFLGGHRFYAGRVLTGILLLLMTLVGLLIPPLLLFSGLWWVIDAFLIHGWIAAHNESLARLVSGGQPLPSLERPPPLPQHQWKHPLHNAQKVRGRDLARGSQSALRLWSLYGLIVG